MEKTTTLKTLQIPVHKTSLFGISWSNVCNSLEKNKTITSLEINASDIKRENEGFSTYDYNQNYSNQLEQNLTKFSIL